MSTWEGESKEYSPLVASSPSKASTPPAGSNKHPVPKASADADADPSRDDARRVITTLPLAGMAFLCVCGGPFGIEDAVGAGGPLLVLVGCVALPILWGLPQAFITAELSTMMDENGGYVLWVRRGLGNFWGWISSYNSMFCNMVDLPLYAVLTTDYVKTYVRRQWDYEFTVWESWSVKAAVVLFVAIMNIRGVSEVSAVAVFMTVVIMLPFVIEPALPAVWEHLDASLWWQTPDTINWSLFVSTMLWNFQGWDSMGCIAGEVKDAKRTYPAGVSIALVMASLCYAIPVMCGIQVVPDVSQWQSGLLETIAAVIAPWIGVWVVAGAGLSNVGEMMVEYTATVRAWWAMGHRKMAPAFLSWEWDRFHTPVAACVFQLVATVVFLFFDFAELVVVDTFFNNLSLLLEAAAFLALRHKEPDTPRPFKVPGGLLGAWVFTFPKFAIIAFGLATAGMKAWLICGGCNIVFAAAYMARSYFVPADDPSNSMDAAKVPIIIPAQVVALDLFTDSVLDVRSPRHRSKSMAVETIRPRTPVSCRRHSDVSTTSRASHRSSSVVGPPPRLPPLPALQRGSTQGSSAAVSDGTQTTPSLSGGLPAPGASRGWSYGAIEPGEGGRNEDADTARLLASGHRRSS